MNSPRRILWLSSKDVEPLLTYELVNRIVEETLKAHGLGLTTLPGESRLKWDDDAWIIAKPGAVKPLSALGLKWLSNYRSNPNRGLPPNYGLIILNSPETGAPLSVMDGDVISKVRTASVSAVAAKYLAKHGSHILGVIGAGIQGRCHLYSMKALMGITEARVCDISQEKLDQLQAEAEKDLPDVSIGVSRDPRYAAQGADILVVASTSNTPVVTEDMAGEGCLVIGLTGFRDLDPKMKNSVEKYVVDDRHNTVEMIRLFMGRLEVKQEEIYGDIGEIVAGRLSGRSSDRERILFTPTGLGVVDVAVARLVYEEALGNGLGTMLEA